MVLVSNILFFLAMTIGCYFLIPVYGVFGPPYAIVIGFSLSLINITLAAVWEYKKIKN